MNYGFSSARDLKRWDLDCDIVYGPIASRRFGFSLGINLLSRAKLCNFDCLYCQCGWTPRALDTEAIENQVPDLVEVKVAVSRQFQQLGKLGIQPETIVFSGNGEPTLHPNFPAIAEWVVKNRNRYLPKALVGILTNGTRLNEAPVKHGIDQLDFKAVKLDAGWEWMDRPLDRFDLDKAVRAWQRIPHIWIQSFFVQGRFDNTFLRWVEPWLAQIKRISPERVQLYTLDRVPAAPGIEPASKTTLDWIACEVRRECGVMTCVYC
ncbi:MAG: radical SAM protein [Acidobacteriota bacterium]